MVKLLAVWLNSIINHCFVQNIHTVFPVLLASGYLNNRIHCRGIILPVLKQFFYQSPKPNERWERRQSGEPELSLTPAS